MAYTLTVSAQRPGAFPTMRDALEVAADESVITIAPGTYREASRCGRRLTLIAAAGEPGSVVIDAESLRRPAIAAATATSRCRD